MATVKVRLQWNLKICYFFFIGRDQSIPAVESVASDERSSRELDHLSRLMEEHTAIEGSLVNIVQYLFNPSKNNLVNPITIFLINWSISGKSFSLSTLLSPKFKSHIRCPKNINLSFSEA